MTKQCLYWKRVTCKDVRGLDFESSLPDFISSFYEGDLLARILEMPRKHGITFDEAVQMATQKRIDAINGIGDKRATWYARNFVQFISESGYHIELSGDEFVFHLSTVEA